MFYSKKYFACLLLAHKLLTRNTGWAPFVKVAFLYFTKYVTLTVKVSDYFFLLLLLLYTEHRSWPTE